MVLEIARALAALSNLASEFYGGLADTLPKTIDGNLANWHFIAHKYRVEHGAIWDLNQSVEEARRSAYYAAPPKARYVPTPPYVLMRPPPAPPKPELKPAPADSVLLSQDYSRVVPLVAREVQGITWGIRRTIVPQFFLRERIRASAGEVNRRASRIQGSVSRSRVLKDHVRADPASSTTVSSSVVRAVAHSAPRYVEASQQARRMVEQARTRGYVEVPAHSPVSEPPIPPPPKPEPDKPTPPPPPVKTVTIRASEEQVRRQVREMADAAPEVLQGMMGVLRGNSEISPLGRSQVAEAASRVAEIGKAVKELRDLNRRPGVPRRLHPPPRPIPEIRLQSAYGPVYISPVDGMVFYTPEALREHLRTYYGAVW